MPSRWFTIAVVLFWMATMTWLGITKLLPPLRVGEPPNYRSVLDQQQSDEPVCWQIRCGGELLGWAAIRIVHQPDQMTAIQGRIFLEELPLEDLAPGWLSKVVKPVWRQAGSLSLEARNEVSIDPLGRLTAFESHVHVAGVADALKINGHVDGNQLHTSITSGEITVRDDRELPPGAFVGDQLFPQTMLPGLRVGQTWTMPVYSPFRPDKNLLQVLQAEVKAAERITWDGESVPTLCVVYRTDSGAGFSGPQETRCKLWVRQDGLVLREHLTVFHSTLEFERLPVEKSERMIELLGDKWHRELTSADRKQILRIVAAGRVVAEE